ncbi:alpha/beta hydrolase [Haladaptatus halobius]|uniref:alpha/beta hydrolase n=1 Tax=Haladaptatus halobius TaxID=2884875 RepID=UPI001D0AD3EE|nr:alpha/beta hydrolase [Haladaptatus halobius]
MKRFTRRRYLRGTAAATTGLSVLGTAGLASAHGYSVISTRGHYNSSGDLNAGYAQTDYDTDGSVPGVDTGCTGELTVHVHGYDNDRQGALNNFDEAYHNLTSVGYGGEVAGFSWDSNAPDKYDPGDWGGFGTGQEIAQKNGYALAQFALDYKYACPNGDLRLTCHSLGAQVVLNALRILDTNSYWDDGYLRFASVHFLGAAQDNEAPTKEWPKTYYAILNETSATFNYHSDDDSTLQNLYWPREADRALGETGYEDGTVPSNYVENDVTSQVGSNHSGYMANCADDVVYHMANDSSYG